MENTAKGDDFICKIYFGGRELGDDYQFIYFFLNLVIRLG